MCSGSPFVCPPASKMRILMDGSAAARRPAITQALVPPTYVVECPANGKTRCPTSSKDDIVFRVNWGSHNGGSERKDERK